MGDTKQHTIATMIYELLQVAKLSSMGLDTPVAVAGPDEGGYDYTINPLAKVSLCDDDKFQFNRVQTYRVEIEGAGLREKQTCRPMCPAEFETLLRKALEWSR